MHTEICVEIICCMLHAKLVIKALNKFYIASYTVTCIYIDKNCFLRHARSHIYSTIRIVIANGFHLFISITTNSKPEVRTWILKTLNVT